MARDQTDADYEYGKLLLDRNELNKRIREAAAGSVEQGFSAETRAEWDKALKEDQAELKHVEARIREVEPQGKIDRAERHASNLEEAAEYKRKKQNRKM